MRHTILVCEDDELHQRTLRLALSHAFDLHFVNDGEGLLRAVHSVRPDAIVLDVALKEEKDGFVFLPKLRLLYPEAPVIVHSGIADYEAVVEAIRLGAADYVAKSCAPKELEHQLLQVVAQHRARRHETCEQKNDKPSDEMVGISDAALVLRQTLARVRDFDGNMLILGEPGVGKEIVAKALRRRMPNGAWEPWVDIDASTIAGSMAESTLFGHDKGAFTGADRERKGLFELAAGGTIYMDEIANMPLDIQAKLLRVLQEKRLTRLGSPRAIDLNFRVIAATNANLATLCRRGEFRFDLYSRLESFAITVPPLRKRRDDIPLLVEHFLRKYSAHDVAVDTAAMDLLVAYGWPGNVRELSNVIRTMLVLSEHPRLGVADLPSKVSEHHGAATGNGEPLSFRDRVKRFEKRLLSRALKRSGGNVSELARVLRMDRSSLYLKLSEHTLSPEPRRAKRQRTH